MNDRTIAINESFTRAIEEESRKFQEYYVWLEKSMPRAFFEEMSRENIILIAHNLIGFDLQDYFSTIHFKNSAIVMCLDSPDADLRVLKNYAYYGIKNYQGYVSTSPLPMPGSKGYLRIAALYFTEAVETTDVPFPQKALDELREQVQQRNPQLSNEGFYKLISQINTRFLHSLTIDRLVMAIDMFFRAQTRDNCQYEVRYNENWEENHQASMQIVLAWRNTPKHNFLYRMARVIHRHHLSIKRVNANYIKSQDKESILVMTLDLHGSNGKAAWDVANIVDFLREFLTVKYFPSNDAIELYLVNKQIVSGNMGNFLRSLANFVHQALVHVDVNLYTLEAIEEALCRHPELTTKLCDAFKAKFDPDFYNYDEYMKIRDTFLADVSKLDTGNEDNDIRRKTVLFQGMNFIHHTLKTNFFRTNITAHSFRLDPRYLEELPIVGNVKKFPELPYAIFFIKGLHFFGFHIRFKDLARGGLRTVYPTHPEQIEAERKNIFSECYHLSLTQHLKNKDIPEGGAKAIIFLSPFEHLESESLVFQKELSMTSKTPEDIEIAVDQFRKEQRLEYLHLAQRSFIESLITIVNCDADGTIKARNIVDYWHHPEYLYLGPDENMHDDMIQWIADFSKKYGYKPGGAFISSKPKAGINHKQYGVTSLGVNAYMDSLLQYFGIDPKKTVFTVKMSGGPDGDVAGNQIYNLYRYYPKTAKLLALIDVSGTIYDPKGLDLETLVDLFRQSKPIKFYPPEKLSEGGFLLDKNTKRSPSAFVQQTLCWRKQDGKLVQDWLSGSEMNHILRYTVHQTKADLFIPAGGRPRTLNETNIKEFLDETGNPTSRGIIEGANLYLTPKARRALEKLGVLIIKDSSANKTGVICSSFEVLCGLALNDETFIENKDALVTEILDRLALCAANEARLLLRTHKETNEFLTDISQETSIRINEFTYQILDYLDTFPWPTDENDPLTRCFLAYCLPSLKDNFKKELLKEIPEHHKKAIVACYIAAQLVYSRGLSWHPSIVDVLPTLLNPQNNVN